MGVSTLIAVVRNDNGELGEDVIGPQLPDRVAYEEADKLLDEELADTFPASDPLPSWAGEEPHPGLTTYTPNHMLTERIIAVAVIEVSEQAYCNTPIPGVLPRPGNSHEHRRDHW